MKKRLQKLFFRRTSLHYKLNIIIALFFLFPVIGFIYFGFKHNILQDEDVPLFFLGLLVFSLLGILMLRKLFDEISRISSQMTREIRSFGWNVQKADGTETDEIQRLIQSFQTVEDQFKATFRQLEKKTDDISILKELSDLCYVTFDPEEILYVMLERALTLTRSEIGSILMLERGETNRFVVRACIGLGDRVQIGDRIEFDKSIAKYAVINKSPLVVADIEKDSRFGRSSRAHYGTKSFVCLPIKTSKDIIGVLTVSRKSDSSEPYRNEDVEVLIPLLSNAAFTYENLRLIRENERTSLHLKSIAEVLKIVSSSFRGTELLQALLNEIQAVVPFHFAVVLVKEEHLADLLTVVEVLGMQPETGLGRGGAYACTGSLVDRVMKQKTAILVHRPENLTSDLDRAVLGELEEDGAGLILPLYIDGDVNGALVLAAERPEVFQDVRHLVQWMSVGLSLAIERNRLSSAVIQRGQELDSIKQIGRALASSTFDTGKVLDYTLEMIQMLMNAEAGTLFLVEEDHLKSAAFFNIRIPLTEPIRLQIGQGVAGYVASRGEAAIVNDAARSPHFYSEIDRISGFETRSLLCVPMISQGRVIGVLEVLNKINGPFDANDADLLQSVASSVSIAIENARLYRETVSMAEHERGIRRIFQKFVPKEILDQIIHGSESGETLIDELRTLTLLNIDIRKSSEFVRTVGPQKTVALLNYFFSVMGEIVFRHHGIVDKYLGDGFLAFFGAPVSSTRDAENAVSAALEMRDAVDDLNRHCRQRFGETITMGISIHTGEVVVGNIGFEKKMDYTVIGDAVNTVFRLQELTKPFPDGILISENVCRAALSRLNIHRIDQSLGNLNIFELVGRATE